MQGIGMNYMALERGSESDRQNDYEDDNVIQTITSVIESDRLTDMRRGKSITLHNKYSVFQVDIDSDDEDDDKGSSDNDAGEHP